MKRVLKAMRTLPPIALVALCALAAASCSSRTSGTPSAGGSAPAPASVAKNEKDVKPAPSKKHPLVFREQELPFRYERGDSGACWPVEPTGGGVGMLDYDGDGDLDLFFAQGVPLPVGKSENPPADVLLRNDGGRFVDVSTEAGLATKGYGMGVCIADYDADGDPDVYVTRYGANTLWRNDRGRFTDVTAEAGVGCPLWSLGAAFADYDGDGDLDLFVANYFDFDPAKAPFEHDPKTGAPDYGPPADFDGQPDVLYRNDGNGHFTDATKQAGVGGKGRGMGVLAADFDADGRIDIFVANDAEANALWHNKGDGTFEDVAFAWGVALNGEGQSEANMGISYGDTDGDLLPDLLVSHFFNEHDTLWRPHRNAASQPPFFADETFEAGLGLDSRPYTGWGAAFADFDQDGWLDLVVVNGHIRREPGQAHLFENPPILWRNAGRGRFQNVTSSAGPYFQSLHQGRGLACGDLDGDGDLDLVVVQHNAPSVVLWNETPQTGRFLSVRLVGAGANRDAIGARVTARPGQSALVRTVFGGGSYLSSSDRALHFGLGDAKRVEQLEVRWPSGREEVRRDVPAGSVVEWKEAAVSERSAQRTDSR